MCKMASGGKGLSFRKSLPPPAHPQGNPSIRAAIDKGPVSIAGNRGALFCRTSPPDPLRKTPVTTAHKSYP